MIDVVTTGVVFSTVVGGSTLFENDIKKEKTKGREGKRREKILPEMLTTGTVETRNLKLASNSLYLPY